MKMQLFRLLVSASRWLFWVLGLPFRAFAGSTDPFHENKKRFQQQEIWNEEYKIWARNGPAFLTRAKKRTCPNCFSPSSDHLWHSQDGYEYVRCSLCRFVYVTPYLDYDDWREYFAMFSEETRFINESVLTSRFEQAYFAEDRKRFHAYLKVLQRYQPRGRVLDIGCLTGSFLALARDRGYDVLGVEYRELAVEKMRSLLGIEALQGFFEELADSMIAGVRRHEIISMWETLEHVLYPRVVLEQ
ncbi:MAG: methyltransferase domain-containing protein, partial [Bacteroidota bacterium]